MQLFVAQQLISQESLENNIMLYGYNASRRAYLETYDLMIIESMWKQRIFMDNLNQWAALGFGNINTFRLFRKNYKYISSIINNNSVDSIFFGDIDNFSHQFGALVFSRKCKIFFFEEGSSQYTYKDHLPEKNLLKLFSSWALDLLVYRPFFHISFRKYRRYSDVKNNKLPICRRYSIVPGLLNEPFDTVLNVKLIVSDKINEVVRSQLDTLQTENKKSFLITSDVYGGPEFIKRYPVYLNVIEQYIQTLDKNSFVLLKLHPNEGPDKQKDIESILRENKLRYLVLSSEINIPVEYYLQLVEPREIAHFMSSTIFYNGYIYPKCSDTNLFIAFYKNCLNKGINMDNLNGLYQACLYYSFKQ